MKNPDPPNEQQRESSPLPDAILAAAAAGGLGFLSMLQSLAVWAPAAGVGLTGAYAALVTYRQEQLAKEVARQLEELRGSKMDRGFFASPEGLDLLRRAWKASLKTNNRQKVALGVRILLRAGQRAPYAESSEEYYSLIEEMSDAELAVADAMYEKYHALELRSWHTNNRGKQELVWNLEKLPSAETLAHYLPDLDVSVVAQALV